MEDEAREEQSVDATVGVYVSLCMCVYVIGDCRGPNGFQEGSRNKHEGNQTLEITTRSKHRIKNTPAGSVSVLYPITQMKNNIHFFSLFSA